MPRILCAALFTLSLAGQAADRQLVEGKIAVTRFGARFEAAGEFLIQDGPNLVPLQVAAGKLLTLRQVTATCTLSSGARMNFWTVRASGESTTHHYVPMKHADSEFAGVWISLERVQIPARAGARPVATFQRSSSYGFNDACVGSWTGYFTNE